MKKLIINLFLLFLLYTANAQTRVPNDGVSPIWYNNGNVGIGTTKPKEKLDIRGNLYINSGIDDNHIYWRSHYMTAGTRPGDYANNYFILKPGGSSQGTLFTFFDMYEVDSESNYKLKNRLSSNGVSFFNGGNIGIGTTEPKEKLDIRGNLYINSGIDDNHIYWGSHYMTAGTRPGDYAHNYFILKPGGSSQGTLFTFFDMYEVDSESNYKLKNRLSSNGVSFFNGGNIGIGTTSNPVAKLQVESLGAIYSESPTLLVRDKTERGTIFLESIKDKPNDFVFKNNNRFSWVMSTRNSLEDYALKFYPSQNGTSWEAPALTMLTNGNIGIGTSNPGNYRLAVEGNIGAREVKVTLDNWADYVFDTDYDLKSLEEIENFIKENKHLPEIPTAQDVEKGGVDLGEMNMLLLKKVEELTLYIIDQQKEINSLKSDLSEIRNEN